MRLHMPHFSWRGIKRWTLAQGLCMQCKTVNTTNGMLDHFFCLDRSATILHCRAASRLFCH